MLNWENGCERYNVAHAAATGEIQENPEDRREPFYIPLHCGAEKQGKAPRMQHFKINAKRGEVFITPGFTTYDQFVNLQKSLNAILAPYKEHLRRPVVQDACHHEAIWRITEWEDSRLRQYTYRNSNVGDVKYAFRWNFYPLMNITAMSENRPASRKKRLYSFNEMVLKLSFGLVLDTSGSLSRALEKKPLDYGTFLNWKPGLKELDSPELEQVECLVVIKRPDRVDVIPWNGSAVATPWSHLDFSVPFPRLEDSLPKAEVDFWKSKKARALYLTQCARCKLRLGNHYNLLYTSQTKNPSHMLPICLICAASIDYLVNKRPGAHLDEKEKEWVGKIYSYSRSPKLHTVSWEHEIPVEPLDITHSSQDPSKPYWGLAPREDTCLNGVPPELRVLDAKKAREICSAGYNGDIDPSLAYSREELRHLGWGTYLVPKYMAVYG